MPFMVREAEDSLVAMLTANGMEAAGANVISITYNGQHQHYGAMAPHSRFIVFAKVRDEAHIRKIDRAIEDALKAAP